MSEWKKARKKPVIVEFREVREEDSVRAKIEGKWKRVKGELIFTREGILFAVAGRDFIIRGVEGEAYPIKKEIFYKTYEVIEKKGRETK